MKSIYAPGERMQGLGPNQLAWLRNNLAGFEVMEKQALAARAQREASGRLAEKAAGEAMVAFDAWLEWKA